MAERVFGARSTLVRAEFEITGVVQQSGRDCEFELTRIHARFDPGGMAALEYQGETDGGLQRVFEIVVGHIDRAIIRILAGKQFLGVSKQGLEPGWIRPRIHRGKFLFDEECDARRVFRVNRRKHGQRWKKCGFTPGGAGRRTRRLRICGTHQQAQSSYLYWTMIAGITGGLGCGKSTVARAFERRGFRRLDSDQIVREQILVAPEVVAAIRERYGDEVIERDNNGFKINRTALATRVFADDAERLWLEELTHPRVFAVWREAIATDPNARWAWFDFTVCVACAPAQQLARLEQRGLPRALAGQRISKQLPLARKIELSHFVLWNEGSSSFLEAQIDRLADALVAA
jgi:dephospho-CoA kinase